MVLLFLLSLEWLAAFGQSTGDLAPPVTTTSPVHYDTLGKFPGNAAPDLVASGLNHYQLDSENDPHGETIVSKMVQTLPAARTLPTHSHSPLLRGARGSVTPSPHTRTNTATLEGTVTDIKKVGIPGATVTVNRIGDSTWLGAQVTDVNGFFKIKNLPQNDTLELSIRFLGFREYNTTLVIHESSLQLDTITLKENSFELESVVVTAERPPIVIKKDTVEYNMSSFSSRPNENVRDAIKKMPGLEFDDGGSLTYNGQRIAKVLVNGREYFGTDGKIALSSLPADVVEKLQIAEARKDGTSMELNGKDMEKVLNIQIKKGIKKFGNLVAAGGTDQRYEFKGNLNKFQEDQSITLMAMTNNINVVDYRDGNNTIMLINAGNGITETIAAGVNYRKMINKNLDFSMSYSYSHPNSYRVSLQDRKQFIIPDSSFFTVASLNTRSITNAHGINVSARIRIDSLNSLQVTFPGLGYSESNGKSSSDTNTIDEAMAPVYTLQNAYESNGINTYIPFNLNFNRYFYNEKKYLQVSLSSAYSRQTNNDFNTANTVFYTTDSVAKLRQEIIQTGKGHNFVGSVQYSFPLFGNFSALLSNSFSFSRSDNSKVTWSLNTDNERISVDTLYSNIFRSQTITNQANAAIHFRVTKFEASGGLTINYNNLNQTNQSSNKNIVQAFNTVSPSLRLGYMLSNTTRLNFNFSAYTSPPSVSQLQPVPNNTNPLYIQVGNPNLKSTFSQVYSLEYHSDTEKRNISYNLHYAPVNNKIINTIQYGSQGEQISSYTNVNGVISISGNLGYGFRRKSTENSYGIKINAGISYGKDKNFVNGVIAGSSQWGINPSVNTDLTINKLLGINLVYRPSVSILTYKKTPSQNQNFTTHQAGMSLDLYLKERFMLRNTISCTLNNSLPANFSKASALWNAYVSYLFLNKRAELSLSAYDLLRQNSNVSRVANQNYIESLEGNNIQQFFMLVVAYYIR
jgi:hypothetical protein